MKKIIFFIFIILLISTSGFFIYKAYGEYKSYQSIENTKKSIKVLHSLDTTLKKVEKELSLSAIYLANEGKSDFNVLQNARDETDNAIKNMAKLKDSLQYVRSRVDVVNSDYKSIFFAYYQEEISKIILHDMRSISDELSLKVGNLKEYILTYIDFIELRNNINKEKSFISYILKQSKKMNKQDLIYWDTMIQEQEFSNFSNLDSDTILSINTTLEPQEFLDLSFKTKAKIALGAANAHYMITTNVWLEHKDEQIQKVELSKQVVYEDLEKKLTSSVFSLPETIIIYTAISFVLILILLILLYKKVEKSYQRESTKTVSDVLSARH